MNRPVRGAGPGHPCLSGRDASFTLYDDDGVTNAYRKGGGTRVTLRWDDSAKRLTASGKLPGDQNEAALLRLPAR